MADRTSRERLRALTTVVLSHHEHEQGEIACTGRVRFPWCETRVAVAALARVSMARLARRAASIAFAANDPDGVRECDSADPSSSSPAAELGEAVARAEAHADALETRMASFPEPPFTAQRLVELLLYPEASGYSTPEKLRVAAEKTLAVTGPGRRSPRPRGYHLGSARSRAARAPRARPCEPRAERIRARAGARGGGGGARRRIRRSARGVVARRGWRVAERVGGSGGDGGGVPGGGASRKGGGPRRRHRGGLRRGRARRRETRAGGERPNEPSFADEMENRLPGKPDVGAELVTAGA